MYETVSIETDSRGVATLWLDREEKHNALSAQMIAELHDAAGKLGQDDDVRVVCLLYTSPSPRDLSTSRMPSSA